MQVLAREIRRRLGFEVRGDLVNVPAAIAHDEMGMIGQDRQGVDRVAAFDRCLSQAARHGPGLLARELHRRIAQRPLGGEAQLVLMRLMRERTCGPVFVAGPKRSRSKLRTVSDHEPRGSLGSQNP